MRVTLKAINDELERQGHAARLEKGTRYFYFSGGATAGWLDRTVSAATINALTLQEWIAGFERLRKLNEQLFGRSPKRRGERARSSRPRRRK